MEDQDNITKLKGKFIRLMYEKGYRGRFFLDTEQQQINARPHELPACLDEIIEAVKAQPAGNSRFDLDTTTIDEIRCFFRVSFNEKSGFRLHEITLEDKRSHEKKFFRLDNNHQIPGSAAVGTLFPKPKQWDNIIKGKFRL